MFEQWLNIFQRTWIAQSGRALRREEFFAVQGFRNGPLIEVFSLALIRDVFFFVNRANKNLKKMIFFKDLPKKLRLELLFLAINGPGQSSTRSQTMKMDKTSAHIENREVNFNNYTVAISGRKPGSHPPPPQACQSWPGQVSTVHDSSSSSSSSSSRDYLAWTFKALFSDGLKVEMFF